MVDASPWYSLLRGEEAALALRLVLKMGLVELMGDQSWSWESWKNVCGFTSQGARTLGPLLLAMEILAEQDGHVVVTPLARETLAEEKPTSRRAYLQMGTDSRVDELVSLLRGEIAPSAPPLYAPDGSGHSVMDLDGVSAEIAWGLASRARNFAEPLADSIARRRAPQNQCVMADIGAGSPYVGEACLRRVAFLNQVILVDRPNGMQHVRTMLQRSFGTIPRLELWEGNFFAGVPEADIYTLSNTVHDWLPEDAERIMLHISAAIRPEGWVIIHEPLLLDQWTNEHERRRGLWMATYGLTLFRLTLGQGRCYTVREHDELMRRSGFARFADPEETADGCSALFYRQTTRP